MAELRVKNLGALLVSWGGEPIGNLANESDTVVGNYVDDNGDIIPDATGNVGILAVNPSRVGEVVIKINEGSAEFATFQTDFEQLKTGIWPGKDLVVTDPSLNTLLSLSGAYVKNVGTMQSGNEVTPNEITIQGVAMTMISTGATVRAT